MLAKVITCAIVGLEGAIVEVEVDISPGLPSFTIVGLPDTAVQEARERVRAAIRNSGCTFPMKRITVNLAPADLKKAGPAYDLPIAVGILLSSEQVSADVSQDYPPRRAIPGWQPAPYQWHPAHGRPGSPGKDIHHYCA